MKKKVQEKSLIEIYLNYHDEYVKKYGEFTLVTMEVGSFAECYSIPNRGPDLKTISNILNIACTKKDKSDQECNIKNPFMLGVPCIAYPKYLRVLIENGYTVVEIVQRTRPPLDIIREVAGVYSIGTYLENISVDTNYIVSLYIEDEAQINTKPLTAIGMSATDLTTGLTSIHEAYDHHDDT